LCKETWRKETHPCASGALRRVRGVGGIFRKGILPLRKTPHIPVRRPRIEYGAGSAGLIRRLRRFGGAPKVNRKSNRDSNSNGDHNRNRNRNRNRLAVTVARTLLARATLAEVAPAGISRT